MTDTNALEVQVLGTTLYHDGNDYAIDSNGSLMLAEGRQALIQWVTRCIATAPNQAPLDPDFGVGAYEYLGAPAADVLKAVLASSIKESLIANDRIGKVTVEDIEAWTDEYGEQNTFYKIVIETPMGPIGVEN